MKDFVRILIIVVVTLDICNGGRIPRRQTLARHAFGKRRNAGSTIGHGTRLSFGKPQEKILCKWYPGDQEFNHPTAGMTNPMLQIKTQEDEFVVQVVSKTGTQSNNNNENDCFVATKKDCDEWWPQCKVTEEEDNNKNNNKWRILKFRRRVGHGTQCYEAVRDKCLNWEFEHNQCGITNIIPNLYESDNDVHHYFQSRHTFRQTSRGCGYDVIHNNMADMTTQQGRHRRCENAIHWTNGGGRGMATFTHRGPLHVVNPVKVVYEIVDHRAPFTTYTSTAYATVKGHWLKGEERLTVALRDDGNVDLEILSCSKPSGFVGHLVWPVVGPLQRRFFQSQLDALSSVAAKSGTPPPERRIQTRTISQQIHHLPIL